MMPPFSLLSFSANLFSQQTKEVITQMQVLEVPKTPPPIFFSSRMYRYTLEEFYALPEPNDGSYYELIEGELFIMPPPKPPHGNIAAYFNMSLASHIIAHKISGKIYYPREPIYIEDVYGTYLEPDMMYVSDALEKKMGDVRTSADIVFEYLPKGTAIYDRTTKADTYLSLGVRELWLIDPQTKTIEVRNAKKKNGQLSWTKRVFNIGETAESQVLKGWRVEVKEVFASLR
jgi:Uma2 family endonuclease